ncbi:MAG: hypothetical protein Q4G26_05400 [Paracoccus sp. (in: a-proteobacteria)]|nr:hypothetical protein [Paracoccus sp. (in: a-proteobacteria)]
MSDPVLFGYWPAIRDADSAIGATRMAGLPVLMMGANAALLALIAAMQPDLDPVLISGLAGVGFLLALLAFRIRAGHAGWLPVVALLFLGFLGANLSLSYMEWQLAGQSQASGAGIVLRWIVPVICLILVIGGLRGWLWLRAHQIRRSF